MRTTATVVAFLTLVCVVAPAGAQGQVNPCAQAIVEAHAARIILRWMDSHIDLREAMLESFVESDQSAALPTARGRLQRYREGVEADLEIYEGLREYAAALTDWKAEDERVCIDSAGEAAYSAEVPLEEVAGYLSNFTAWGRFRPAPR